MDRFSTTLPLMLVLMSLLLLTSAQDQQYSAEPNVVLATATAVLTGNVHGNITFTTQPDHTTRIQGTVCGLTQGLHGFHVHEKGDLSGGCATAGGHYNPFKKNHGGPDSPERHVGDLGNILVDATCCAHVDIIDHLVSLEQPNSVLGRALVIHKGVDDLGLGGNPDSLKTGNAGGRAGCAVIGIA